MKLWITTLGLFEFTAEYLVGKKEYKVIQIFKSFRFLGFKNGTKTYLNWSWQLNNYWQYRGLETHHYPVVTRKPLHIWKFLKNAPKKSVIKSMKSPSQNLFFCFYFFCSFLTHHSMSTFTTYTHFLRGWCVTVQS